MVKTLFRPMKKENSIVFKIGAILTLVLIAVIVLMVSYNIYSFLAASQNTKEQQRRVMNVHSQQMQAVFASATTTLDELALDNLEKANTMTNANSLRRYLASMGLGDILATKVDSNPRLACLYFLYSDLDVYLMRYSSTLDWRQKFLMEDVLRGRADIENDALSNAWHVLELGGSCFLWQNYKIGPANIGVLISAEDLLKGMQSKSDMQSAYLLTDETGRILASENEEDFPPGEQIENAEAFAAAQGPYVMFTEDLARYGIRLSCAILRAEMYAGMEKMQYFLGGLGILVVLVVAVVSRYLNRNIVGPVKKLAVATQELERGNVDYQISVDRSYAKEFSNLILLFNNMTREIKDLKIQNYEEALERKNAELKYLQLQLHPHFYLNAITTISSLSMRGENEQIQRFIEALSTYLRYLFTDNQESCTVRSEVQHAEDFIRLQQIRHVDRIFYYCSVEPQVADVPLQKLLVQTFVENIFKHAFDGEASISIFIRGSRARRGGEDFAKITIEDTGCGFSAELLRGADALREEKHVGIWNVGKTLEFTYGRKDLLCLSNNEQGGACVEIYIPLDRSKEKAHESTDR